MSEEVEQVEETPAVPEKKFTQEDVNRIVQREKKAIEKRMEDEKKAVEKELQEIRQQLPAPAPPDDNDYKGQLVVAKKEFASKLEALNRELESQRRAADSEREARLQGERERVLLDALTAANCNDLRVGKKLYLDNVRWSEEHNGWMFFPDNPNEVTLSVKNAVEICLPDYLRHSAAVTGGAGTPVGRPGSVASVNLKKQQSFDAARNNLAALYKKVKNKGSAHDLKVYNQEKAKLVAMAKELNVFVDSFGNVNLEIERLAEKIV